MSTSDVVIDVKKLNKYFGQNHAVKDLSLIVKKGEIFGFLGANGSGKTTTIRMLCGLLTPDQGEGHCLGYDIIKQSYEIKRRTGYMTQRFSYYAEMSVYENLLFMARIYELSDKHARVREIIQQFNLSRYQNELAGNLSGGWQQRLALAASVLHKPQLLLLDEPTAGVDPKARREFWDYIYSLSQEGIATLVSTHYMDEAERCTKLAYISLGALIIEGSIKEIIEKINLSTWLIQGSDLNSLIEELKSTEGADEVVMFGNAVHVSGRDHKKLDKIIQQYRDNKQYEFKKIESNLEDVFISLVDSGKGAKK